VNRNVFDLQEADAPSFIARLANRLHARTRAGVIRGSLLVNPGGPLRLGASRRERAGFAQPERLQPCADRYHATRRRLALRVATTDGWSTKPQIGYSSAGGDVTWMVGLVEDNLLGTATSSPPYTTRRPTVARSISAREPPLPLAPWLAASQVQQQVGRRPGHLAGGSAVLRNRARRAFTTDGEAASERVLVFRDGDTSAIVERAPCAWGSRQGCAPHATSAGYLRLWLAAQWRREDFAPEGTTVFPRSGVRHGGCGNGRRACALPSARAIQFLRPARGRGCVAGASRRCGRHPARGDPSGQAGVGPEVSGQLAAPWRSGFVVLQARANGRPHAGFPTRTVQGHEWPC